MLSVVCQKGVLWPFENICHACHCRQCRLVMQQLTRLNLDRLHGVGQVAWFMSTVSNNCIAKLAHIFHSCKQ